MTTWMWAVVVVGALGWGAGFGLDLLMRIEDVRDRRRRERIMQQRCSRAASSRFPLTPGAQWRYT